jgi:IPT/TIG domain
MTWHRMGPARLAGMALVVVAMAGTSVPSGAVAVAGSAAPSGWGLAQEDDNLVGLNAYDQADVISVVCPTADGCTAVGLYRDWHAALRPFTMDEQDGTWGAAHSLPDFDGLDVGFRSTEVVAACSTVGNCAISGLYGSVERHALPYVANEVDGIWHGARPMTGLPAYALTTDSQVNAISCAAPGSCVVGGLTYTGADARVAFLDDEVAGVWQPVQLVAGVAALDPSLTLYPMIDSVSCPAVGSCAAVGEYEGLTGSTVELGQFVVTETAGVWGAATAVPGLAPTPGEPAFPAWQIACAASGDCVLAGTSTPSGGRVAEEVDGTWETAVQPTTGGGSPLPLSSVTALSCPGVGDCTIGGVVLDDGNAVPAVDAEVGGTWAPARVVPGVERLPWFKLEYAAPDPVTSISCRTATDCALTGDYTTSHGTESAYVDSEVAGRWTGAMPIPGTWAWSRWSFTQTSEVACGAPGRCVVGGTASDDRRPTSGRGDEQGFLDSYGPRPVVRSLSRTTGTRIGGTRLVVYGANFVGPVSVRFGHHPAFVVAVLGRGAIEVATPRGRGPETVSVTTDTGTSAGGAGTHFVFR